MLCVCVLCMCGQSAMYYSLLLRRRGRSIMSIASGVHFMPNIGGHRTTQAITRSAHKTHIDHWGSQTHESHTEMYENSRRQCNAYKYDLYALPSLTPWLFQIRSQNFRCCWTIQRANHTTLHTDNRQKEKMKKNKSDIHSRTWAREAHVRCLTRNVMHCTLYTHSGALWMCARWQ